MCGAVTTPRYRPFCSRHCADDDLMNWLGGRYRITSGDDESAGSGLAGDGQGEDE
ncbi:MAG: DNA gyrase inhibitor YacG [Alphaproteobacteria bacterium]